MDNEVYRWLNNISLKENNPVDEDFQKLNKWVGDNFDGDKEGLGRAILAVRLEYAALLRTCERAYGFNPQIEADEIINQIVKIIPKNISQA